MVMKKKWNAPNHVVNDEIRNHDPIWKHAIVRSSPTVKIPPSPAKGRPRSIRQRQKHKSAKDLLGDSCTLPKLATGAPFLDSSSKSPRKRTVLKKPTAEICRNIQEGRNVQIKQWSLAYYKKVSLFSYPNAFDWSSDRSSLDSVVASSIEISAKP